MSSQYRVPVLEQYEYQQKILSQVLTAPPGSPAKGDRYIVAATATGAWATHEKSIAWYDGAAWQFDAPAEGWQVYDDNVNRQFIYSGTAWIFLAGDMSKATYDTDNSGRVDKAESVDDGAGNATTAAQVKTSYANTHVQGTDQGLDTGGANATTAAQVKSAVTNSHVQGTDQGLDTGGANAVTAAQVKQAYDRRGTYDSGLKSILFNL